jgi:transposase
MGRLTEQEQSLSEIRKYRKFTAQQKTEIVLASLRGPKTMAELCREHDIADSLLRKWREQFLAAGLLLVVSMKEDGLSMGSVGGG